MYNKRMYFKNITLIGSLVTIIILLSSNIGFSFSEPFNLYPTFLIIKEEYPEFLARLKDGWVNESDSDFEKEEKIGMFFQDLDNETESKGPLNELNFNNIMYTSFNKVIKRSKHRDLFRTLLRSFSEEIDYTEGTGRLHPNLYPIRDAVKKSILTRSVIEILPLDGIRAKHYTLIGELDLPTTVDIRTSNNTRETIPIRWDFKSSIYDDEIIGEYSLIGNLDLTKFGYIIPTEDVAIIKVEVIPYIENIEIPSIEIEYGGELKETILPEKITVNLSDSTNELISDIAWDIEDAYYDKYMPGHYDITGQAYIDIKDRPIYHDGNIVDINLSLEVKKPHKMPGGGKTIVVGNEGYYLKDIEDDYLLREKIEGMISENENVLVKLSDDIFINKKGDLVNMEEIPEIKYYFNREIVGIYEGKDGILIKQ